MTTLATIQAPSPPVSSSSSSLRKHGVTKKSLYVISSLQLVIGTALITWIASILWFTPQHDEHLSSPHAPFSRMKLGLQRRPRAFSEQQWASREQQRHQRTDELKSQRDQQLAPSLESPQQRNQASLAQQHDLEHHHPHKEGGMQGGKKFSKKLKSYVNVTGYDGPSATWKPHAFPCVQVSNEAHMLVTPAHTGLLFQRPVKTGSTTLTAIILRLVERYAAPGKRCRYRAMHATSRDLEFGQRDRELSFLFSVVRDPTHKAISRYFHFDVSVGQKVPTDKHFRQIMRRPYNQNDLAQQLMTKPKEGLSKSVNPEQVVLDILNEYDFIAITERMDESLIVFKLLLGLDLYDILYIKARSAGTFSNGPAVRPCIYLIPAFLTPGMEEFFESKEWKNSNAIDILLYKAAYKSLDNTIEALGKALVQRELEEFHKAQELAADYCRDQVKEFCTPGGNLTPRNERTCVIWGEGCDFACLNNFRNEKKLG